MENSPITSDEEKPKDEGGKKKKKAATLGGMAVEPKAPVSKDETAEDIWSRLSLIKRKGGQTKEIVPLVELDTPAVRQTPEADEAAAPLEQLSLAEAQVVAREIVTAEQQNAPGPSGTGRNETDAETGSEVIAAVEAFRRKITEDNQLPDQAFAETLKQFALTPEPEVREQHTTEALSEGMVVETGSEPTAPLSEAVSQPVPSPVPGAEEQPTGPQPFTGGGLPPAWPPRFTAPADEHFPRAAAAVPAAGVEQAAGNQEANAVGALFLGGIIGYLIGRRRGRIKTRKKLLPIQRKLEKQVTQLREDIQRKEFYISKVVSEQAQDRQKVLQMEQNRKKPETSRAVALEANQLHGKVAPERIGRVLMTADEEAPKPEMKTAKPPEERPEKMTGEKRAATLSRNELLELSGRVKVENTNLRRVYETHLVSEQGLRRLVDEYLRGGDVQRALREELVEHEIDFERDPVLRDHGRTSPPETAASGGSPTLSGLLQKAGVSETDQDDKFTAQAKQLYARDQQHEHLRHRRFIDISMITIIFILLLLVITLVISRQ